MADRLPPYTIFYSWQSDSPRKYNWQLVHEALEGAIDEVQNNPTVPMLPKLDFGMESIAGTPEVATTVFRKIKSCAIFVGDVTAVGTIPRHDGGQKRTANPNVMVEMGFAAGTIGWERIICVMNEAFGNIEDMPIDVRHRRFPIRYRLSEENKAEKDKTKRQLVRDLRAAIEVVVLNDMESVKTAEQRFDSNCIQVVGHFRRAPYSHAPKPGTFVLGSSTGVDSAVLDAAIPRLLDLGLIYCDHDSRQNLYAYHWTALGLMHLKWKWPDDELPVPL